MGRIYSEFLSEQGSGSPSLAYQPAPFQIFRDDGGPPITATVIYRKPDGSYTEMLDTAWWRMEAKNRGYVEVSSYPADVGVDQPVSDVGTVRPTIPTVIAPPVFEDAPPGETDVSVWGDIWTGVTGGSPGGIVDIIDWGWDVFGPGSQTPSIMPVGPGSVYAAPTPVPGSGFTTGGYMNGTQPPAGGIPPGMYIDSHGHLCHRRRRRRRMLTESDFNDLMRIATLPNKQNVTVALAKAIGRR